MNSQIIYAALERAPATLVYYAPANGPGGGIFKSTNGGATWKQIDEGIPVDGRGRIGISVSPTNRNRIYAAVDAKDGGIFRSDNAGLTWTRLSNDKRLWDRGWYFEKITADPKDADTVYVMNTSMYKSTDAGKNWTAIKGAPGGDDYHQLWINPNDTKRMIMASDQGSIVSIDGAQSWSSWYNQPTAQIYHVAPDYRFPYWITGAQQDSGAVGSPSRSRHSEISNRDWEGLCSGGESGYTAPDPLHPEILFGGTVLEVQRPHGAKLKMFLPNVEAYAGTVSSRLTTAAGLSRPIRDRSISQTNFFTRRQTAAELDQISQDMTREDPGVPESE
jgi:hypothetical protein